MLLFQPRRSSIMPMIYKLLDLNVAKSLLLNEFKYQVMRVGGNHHDHAPLHCTYQSSCDKAMYVFVLLHTPLVAHLHFDMRMLESNLKALLCACLPCMLVRVSLVLVDWILLHITSHHFRSRHITSHLSSKHDTDDTVV